MILRQETEGETLTDDEADDDPLVEVREYLRYRHSHWEWTQTTQNDAIPGLVSGGYIAQLPGDPQVNTSGSTCCYLYYSGNGTTDYKYMLHNCPTSSACMAPGSATSSFTDPARIWSCAVYTPGGAAW